MGATCNSQYSVFVAENQVYVTDVAGTKKRPESLPCPGGIEGRYSALALCHSNPHLLALACSSQIYIVDLKKRDCRYSLAGIGRVVTAIAYAPEDAGCIATAHIDGSICIWHSSCSQWPSIRLPSTSEPCQALTFAYLSRGLLASASHDQCQIWDLGGGAAKLLASINPTGGQICNLAWCESKPERFAVSTLHGELLLYDTSPLLRRTSSPAHTTASRRSGDDFTPIPSVTSDSTLPAAMIDLRGRLDFISWTGPSTLLGLIERGRECLLIRVDQDDLSMDCAWSCTFECMVRSVGLRIEDGNAFVHGNGEDGLEEHPVPQGVFNGLDFHGGLLNANEVERAATSTLQAQPIAIDSSPTILPVPVYQMRSIHPSFSKTSRQLQQRRHLRLDRSSGKLDAALNEIQLPPGLKAAKDSLPSSVMDATSTIRNEAISPMPFLSPNIPSREQAASQAGFFTEKDPLPSIQLPRPSLESPVLPLGNGATITHESDDSDDETYADELQGSMTFLPGGINVPLPKACGALFHPNGQLLTFFPPKPQHSPTREAEMQPGMRPKRSTGERILRLFPSYGNLEELPSLGEDDSSVDSLEIFGGETEVDSLPIEHPSRPTLTSNPPLRDPIKVANPATFDTYPSTTKLVVRVYDIDDLQLLSPAIHGVAGDYRILCEGNETGAELCLHNATVAFSAGFIEVAHAWRIISKLLEDQVPLRATDPLNDGLWRVAQKLQLLTLDNSGAGLLADQGSFDAFGKLCWATHPFGRTWIMRKVLEWADRRADVQFLACATAVLAQSDDTAPWTYPSAQQSMLHRLPTHSLDFFVVDPHTTAKATQATTPLLRTRAASVPASVIAYPGSPKKRGHDIVSDPSQRSVAQLEAGSTPPWSLSALTRQSTNLSATGSISPETHRGSFGAPASRTQSYAQSISDKAVAFFNASSASKTDGTASAIGALSSSMPGGSWAGKSVSFASTTNTDGTQANSWSSVPRLLRRDSDDGDSDRTLEDGSTPHTPKTPISGPAFTLTNTSRFVDETSGGAKARLVPDDLEQASHMWCQYYGELLRSWDMHTKASELEKVMGLTVDIESGSHAPVFDLQGSRPIFRHGERNSCCIICETMASGKVQTCPECLHVSHTQCTEEFLTELSDVEFSCPSGCGCRCSALPYVVQEIHSQLEPKARHGVKKTPSFTDPRRWRARIEGDSW